MFIVVDPHSGVPVYRQLMDQVKFHIASGMLRAGDELLSTRALATHRGNKEFPKSSNFLFAGLLAVLRLPVSGTNRFLQARPAHRAFAQESIPKLSSDTFLCAIAPCAGAGLDPRRKNNLHHLQAPFL